MLSFTKWIVGRLLRLSRNFVLHYKTYKLHGLFLPESVLLLSPENIRFGIGVSISSFCQIICQDPEHGSTLIIGDRVALNFGVHINADNGGIICIGNDVLIGPMTTIRAANHRFADADRLIREQGHKAGSIIIEDNVWIGGNAVILPDVVIGHGSVIGAGSVVTKSIPPFSVAVGNPATVIRSTNVQQHLG